MEKAYDFKGLVDGLKEQGAEVAEEAAKAVVIAVFDWLEKSADLSATPYDNLLKPFYPQAKAYVLAEAEKINKVG
jgi:hypothetical protein